MSSGSPSGFTPFSFQHTPLTDISMVSDLDLTHSVFSPPLDDGLLVLATASATKSQQDNQFNYDTTAKILFDGNDTSIVYPSEGDSSVVLKKRKVVTSPQQLRLTTTHIVVSLLILSSGMTEGDLTNGSMSTTAQSQEKNKRAKSNKAMEHEAHEALATMRSEVV